MQSHIIVLRADKIANPTPKLPFTTELFNVAKSLPMPSDNAKIGSSDEPAAYEIVKERFRQIIFINEQLVGYTNSPDSMRDMVLAQFGAIMRRFVAEKRSVEFQVKLEEYPDGRCVYKLYDIQAGWVMPSSWGRYKICTISARPAGRMVLPKAA